MGCVLPHSAGVRGCRHTTNLRRCFYCPYNPFYEVTLGGNEAEIIRCSPGVVESNVLCIATKLLLDVNCVDFSNLVENDAIQPGRNTEAISRDHVVYNEEGIAVQLHHQRGPAALSGDQQFLEVFVDTPRTFNPCYGKLFVSFQGRLISSRSTPHVKSLWVPVTALSFPTDSNSDNIRSFIWLNH